VALTKVCRLDVRPEVYLEYFMSYALKVLDVFETKTMKSILLTVFKV